MFVCLFLYGVFRTAKVDFGGILFMVCFLLFLFHGLPFPWLCSGFLLAQTALILHIASSGFTCIVFAFF